MSSENLGALMLQAADVLEKAADLYQSEKVEWCRGAWVRAVSRPVYSKVAISRNNILTMCAEGALLTALGVNEADLVKWQKDYSLDSETMALLTPEEAIVWVTVINGLFLTTKSGSVPSWNDEEERTKDEVIDAFLETAKNLRNEAPNAGEWL